MSENILDIFKEIYDKQTELSNLTDFELFSNFSNSEVHTVDLIGNTEGINGVLIAEKLGITRGAVSKIISKLNKKGLIIRYKKADNKKEIYYKLTDAGFEIYNQHKRAHIDWIEREKIYFDSIDRNEILIFKKILEEYNEYLKNLVIERSE